MKINEILNKTHHRPWSIPQETCKFYQEWNRVIFLHYKVNVKDLLRFIPEPLDVDLFEDEAWISLVGFDMKNIRPKNLPSFNLISNFYELNFRTYVRHKGKSGVYFLSIEASKKISVALSKKLSDLPYRFSNIKRYSGNFSVKNEAYGDEFMVNYEPKKRIDDKTELDVWLTERYALFQDTPKSVNKFEIHHLPWDLQKTAIDKLKVNYSRFNFLLKENPDLIHYSEGIQVVAWGKETITG